MADNMNNDYATSAFAAEIANDMPNSHQGQLDNNNNNSQNLGYQDLDLFNLGDNQVDALTADQAFLLDSERKLTNSDEDDYAQDKDFESISDEIDNHEKHKLEGSNSKVKFSPKAIVRSPESRYAEQPLMTHQLKKPLMQSSGNLHIVSGGYVDINHIVSRMNTQETVKEKPANQKQQTKDAMVLVGGTPTVDPVVVQILPVKQITNNYPSSSKRFTQLIRNQGVNITNNRQFDKSMQIRNSYSKYIGPGNPHSNHQGNSSQRPAIVNQPAFVISGGAGFPNNQQSEQAVGTRTNQRRNKGGKNTASQRSKTVKPLNEPVMSGIKAQGQAIVGSNTQLAGTMAGNTKNVDLLVIGAGPASLGFLVSAVKQQRFGELIQDDGIAILDSGIAFGGGMLSNYGINSNTSANSFLKCIFRKLKDSGKNQTANYLGQNTNNFHGNIGDSTTAKNKRRQKSVGKERVNQYQKTSAVPKQLTTDQQKASQRDRQISPVMPQKWMTNGPNNRGQKDPVTPDQQNKRNQQQMIQSIPRLEQRMAAAQKPFITTETEEIKLQKSTENETVTAQEAEVVGQPQDPDMIQEDEELQPDQSAQKEEEQEQIVDDVVSGDNSIDDVTKTKIVKAEDEKHIVIEEEQQIQGVEKDSKDEGVPQIVPESGDYAFKDQEPKPAQAVAIDQLQTPNMAAIKRQQVNLLSTKRRKSREESSLAAAGGRNTAKKPQVTSSQTTNQNRLKQSNSKVPQTSLAIYSQSNLQATPQGPSSKNLLTSNIKTKGEPLICNHFFSQTRLAAPLNTNINKDGTLINKRAWTSDDVLTPFKEIFPSNISSIFRRLAKQIVPLSLVGHLLNYVGNHLLHYAFKSAGKRIFMPKHKALSIHLMGNGDIVTQVLKTEFTIVPCDQSFKVVEGQQSIVYFRSKALVIAGGAQQGLDQRITNDWFPNLEVSKLIASDSFLKKNVYLQQLERLRTIQSKDGEKKRPKVVIIGGSHSGFSCAWLMLNGPAMYQRCLKTLQEQEKRNEKEGQTPVTATATNKVPYAFRKSIRNCVSCCNCGIAINIANQKLDSKKDHQINNHRQLEELRTHSKTGPRAPRGLSVANRELSPINKNSRHLSKTIKQKKDLASLKQTGAIGSQLAQDIVKTPAANLMFSPDPKLSKVNELAENIPETHFNCSCLCKCFGYFKYDEWPNLDTAVSENKLKLPDFSEGDIKILYRDRIKVFFKTVKDATDANYEEFDKTRRDKKNKEGYVYSFTGLRGDAKQLYLDVTSGKEKRVRFVKAETAELQKPHVEEADLVIWACGYQSNSIKIHDVDKKELALSQKVPNTQFDVDGKNRIILADGNVLNKVFACGVGFPVRTKDGGSGNLDPTKNPRADSFSLYMHTVGEVLLKSLLPKKKIAAILSHKEAANPYLKAATYEQIMKDKQSKGKSKKPLLQQVSTKKEKTMMKISYQANVPAQKAINSLKQNNIQQTDVVQQAAFLYNDTTNIYLNYLQKNQPQNSGSLNNAIAKMRPSAATSGLNSDLDDLPGFNHIQSIASKSNTFHSQNHQNQIIYVMPGEDNQQKNPLALDVQNTTGHSQGDLPSIDFIEPVLKFPEIASKRDSDMKKQQQQQNSFKHSSQTKKMLDAQYQQIGQHYQQQRQSLSSLQPKEGSQNIEAHIKEEQIDFNDRDNSMSVNVLPSSQHNLLQGVKGGNNQRKSRQQLNENSQKSIERLSTNLPPRNQLTQVINNNDNISTNNTGKSPLLLQKKQQMMIQKTKEPSQNYQNAGSQQVTTMSNLKPTSMIATVNAVVAKANGKVGNNKVNSGHVKSSKTGKDGGKDHYKKQMALLASVDQSPYLHFGLHANDVKRTNNSIHGLGHTQKSKGGYKRGDKSAKDGSSGMAMFKGSYALVPSQQQSSNTGKASNAGRNTIGKDEISQVIQRNTKNFKDREQNASARYTKAQGNQSKHLGHNVLKRDHISSVDISTSKNTQFMLNQSTTSTKGGVVPVQDLITRNQDQKQTQQQHVYSVKSLVSNSELFPPIVTGSSNASQIAADWQSKNKSNAGSVTQKNTSHHMRNVSNTQQNKNDLSIRSLTLSQQASIGSKVRRSSDHLVSLSTGAQKQQHIAIDVTAQDIRHDAQQQNNKGSAGLKNNFPTHTNQNEAALYLAKAKGISYTTKAEVRTPAIKGHNVIDLKNEHSRSYTVGKVSKTANFGKSKKTVPSCNPMAVNMQNQHKIMSELTPQITNRVSSLKNFANVQDMNMPNSQALSPRENVISSIQDQDQSLNLQSKDNILDDTDNVRDDLSSSERTIQHNEENMDQTFDDDTGETEIHRLPEHTHLIHKKKATKSTSIDVGGGVSGHVRKPSQIQLPKNGDLDDLKQGGGYQHYESSKIEKQNSVQKMLILPSAVDKEYESVANYQKTSTNKVVSVHSKKINQQVDGIRRNIGGTVSASDLQQAALNSVQLGVVELTNKYSGTKGHRQSVAVTVKIHKDQKTSSSGLFDKLVSNHHAYLEPTGGSSHNLNSVTKTQPQNQSRKRLSLRQKQVQESQNAKFKQLIHQNVQAAQIDKKDQAQSKKVLQQQPQYGDDVTPVKADRESYKDHDVKAAAKNNNSLSLNAKATRVKQRSDSHGASTPLATSKKIADQPSLQQNSNGYSRQANGFFVHKTIRDLQIGADLDFQPTVNLEIAQAKDSTAQVIKTIRKEVQSKAANLSPVLKKRGQSKVNLKGQSSTQLIQEKHSAQERTPAAGNSKYKSPLRTTLKSAMSQSSTKEHPSRQTHQQNLQSINKGNSMRPSNNYQAQVIQASLRSPKSSRRSTINNQQPQHINNTLTESITEPRKGNIRSYSKEKVMAAASLPLGLQSSNSRQNRNAAAQLSQAVSSGSLSVGVSQVQIKKEILGRSSRIANNFK